MDLLTGNDVAGLWFETAEDGQDEAAHVRAFAIALEALVLKRRAERTAHYLAEPFLLRVRYNYRFHRKHGGTGRWRSFCIAWRLSR